MQTQGTGGNVGVAALAAAAVGLVIGTIGGFISGATGWQIGLISWAIGFAVAWVLVTLSRRNDGVILGLALGLTLLGTFFGEIIFTWRVLGDVPLGTLVADAPTLLKFIVTEDPITLIFWAIGLYAAYRTVRGMHVAQPNAATGPAQPAPGRNAWGTPGDPQGDQQQADRAAEFFGNDGSGTPPTQG